MMFMFAHTKTKAREAHPELHAAVSRTEVGRAARGPGIPEGSRISEIADIVDLAPTILQILDVSCRDELAGTPIPING